MENKGMPERERAQSEKKGVAALEEKAEKRGKSQLATIVPMG